jgi:two-component system, cell cycle sensor histidine kinase and response regulator CckA
MIKQPITRFILKKDQDVYYLLRRQLFATGELQTCELQMEKKDGTPFWARLEATVTQGSDGVPVLRLVMSDITDHKQVEAGKVKNEVQNRQIQKTKSLGLMAGAIAHHFNNQLQVVMGGLEMAISDLPLGVKPTQSLLSAMLATRKAAEVSTLMLTYLGQTPGRHEPIDLSEACRRNLILLQTAAPKGTLINADFPASGPVIRSNADQIQHILTNLITNAWESADVSRRGIGLTIKTVSQSDLLAIKGFPVDWEPRDPAYACLEIADAGCGIAEENIEKIFDPFFSTKFTGRGLGLPVVLGIVRAHHGVVTVESEPGRGSIFRVFFPVSVEEVHRLPDSAAQTPETKQGGTLLVVEDETGVREITNCGHAQAIGFQRARSQGWH